MDQQPDNPSDAELFRPDTPPGPGLTTAELFAKLEREVPGLASHAAARNAERGVLGMQLYTARMSKDLSQYALAERSGVRQPDISAIECGGGNPTRRTLEKLGVALGIDFTIGASSAA